MTEAEVHPDKALDDALTSELRTQLKGEPEAPKAEPETPKADTKADAEPANPDATGERQRDAQGRFVPKAEGEPDKTTVESSAAPDNAEVDELQTTEPEKAEIAATIEPPPALNPAEREAFGKLPQEAQALVAGQYKSLQADYTRKTQELSLKSQLADAFIAEVQPYEAMIRGEGSTAIAAVRNLLNAAYVLRTGTQQQKAALLAQTAQQFGVDLQGLDAAPAGPADPHVASLTQELQELKRELAESRQSTAQQLTSEASASIAAFRADPQNIHMQAVEKDMGALLMNGLATSLKDAYDKACRMNPTIFAEIQRAERVKSDEALKAERARKAQQARAAAGVIVDGGAAAAAAPMSLEDEVRQQFRARA